MKAKYPGCQWCYLVLGAIMWSQSAVSKKPQHTATSGHNVNIKHFETGIRSVLCYEPIQNL